MLVVKPTDAEARADGRDGDEGIEVDPLLVRHNLHLESVKCSTQETAAESTLFTQSSTMSAEYSGCHR